MFNCLECRHCVAISAPIIALNTGKCVDQSCWVCYTLTRLDVSHEKSLYCGTYSPSLTFFLSNHTVDCCLFEIIRNTHIVVINQKKKDAIFVLNEDPSRLFFRLWLIRSTAKSCVTPTAKESKLTMAENNFDCVGWNKATLTVANRHDISLTSQACSHH